MAQDSARKPKVDSSTSSSLSQLAHDFTLRVATLASPVEFARQVKRRRWQLLMLGLLIGTVVLVVWGLTRDTLPRPIRIAAGPAGGQYEAFAQELAVRLERRTGHRVEVITDTPGSVDNCRRLVGATDADSPGRAHLAIVQAGALDVDRAETVTPLYPECVLVVVRRGSGIESVADLAGRRIAAGVAGSGSRATAGQVLGAWGLSVDDLADPDAGFEVLRTDTAYDGAIVVSGMHNPALRALFAEGDYRVLPLERAAAMAIEYRHFDRFELPVGVLCSSPPVPDTPTPIVRTMSLLVTTPREPGFPGQPQLVEHALYSVFAVPPDLRLSWRTLIDTETASAWKQVPQLHRDARGWFDPYEGLEFVASVMESLSGIKELFVALVVIGFVLRNRWKKIQSRAETKLVEQQREQLNQYLERTVRLERKASSELELRRLRRYRAEAAKLKFEAMNSLTHDELRSDPQFLIFVLQYAQLADHLNRRMRELGDGDGVGPVLPPLAPQPEMAVPVDADAPGPLPVTTAPVEPVPSAPANGHPIAPNGSHPVPVWIPAARRPADTDAPHTPGERRRWRQQALRRN